MLQVVAIAVFLALGFAFYVFFVPFVGGDRLQYLLMGLYTPLITCVILLYIWCAGTDPGDPGIFLNSKRPPEKQGSSTHEYPEGVSFSNCCRVVHNSENISNNFEVKDSSSYLTFTRVLCLIYFPFSCLCKRWFHSDDQSSEQNTSEEGMFFCSLCKAEVLQHSKHCRVCNKCVDGFDHHCRWLNNCIGKRNYKGFFILLASAVLLLIMKWLVGALVLILFFMKRGEFSGQITSKLGSSFSVVAFVIVVVTCTLLAMVATIPLSQLLCFHILLIKKGISTYDYIVALREQEQQEHSEHQSPQISIISSITGLSTSSSFGPLHRGSWCTPPRLLVEDQDVFHPDMPQNSTGKKARKDEGSKRKPPGAVKISTWSLARLNAEDVTKAAVEAKKRSKVLQPITRRGNILKPDKRTDKSRVFLPVPEQSPDPMARTSASGTDGNLSDMMMETPASLAPLQHEARSDYQPSAVTSIMNLNLTSSPESSLESPDLHPFRISMSGADELRSFMSLAASESTAQKTIALSRSTSGGYEASGGDDSDQIPSRIVHRSSNWTNVILNSGRQATMSDLNLPRLHL